MRVLLLSHFRDTAGQQAALRAALAAERPDWTVDQMRRKPHPFGYPTQHEWDADLARELWAAADVVHFDQDPSPRLGEPKPAVVQHHGSEYRSERKRARADRREADAVQVATTLDLARDGVAWLPVVADLDALAAIRRELRPGPPFGSLRVAHSPSDPGRKDTVAIEAAVRLLRESGFDVTLDVITGVSWSEALRRKAAADVFVDQLTLGYGLSAVEAWAMGIPVVAGVADPEVRARMVDEWGRLPFVEATPASLGEILVGFLYGSGDWGEIGRAHAERYHGQAAIADRLEALYARVAEPRYDPARYWRERGRTYEARFRRTEPFIAQERALVRLLRGLQFGSVLEVGCGFGRIGALVRAARPAATYTGVDVSAEMLASAQARIPGGRFVESTLADFAAADTGRYDLVIASEFLMHQPPATVGRAVDALRQLARRDIVTIDWDAPGEEAGGYCFGHDYAALLPGATRVPVGRQAISHLRVGR